MKIYLFIAICILLLVIILLLIFRNKSGFPQLKIKIEKFQSNLNKIESNLKEDFRTNREENSNIAAANRKELTDNLISFRTETIQTLNNLAQQNVIAIEKLNKVLEEKVESLINKTEFNFKENRSEIEKKLLGLTEQAKTDSFQMRESLVKALKDFQDVFDRSVKSFNELQREKFNIMETKQGELINSTEKRLEEMRLTVDEKLQKTLTERLGQSFEVVGRQLENVQKGLGEMQTLAQDVGGLKKVLSNVKM